ncbi:MAG: (2Fe-2S) ferredoxin domain-containing protein [Anaeromicrobium sp.]|uniref:(2Fe-2S) ferredoxin domain-containing protein n=1 Tax=Anaeromicrobium sp. TaxID=1929132 RepID=UPI002ED2D641|nr:(2Fe-2S) ferredoxin domain-containing protein [Anaeromicrobium sp.]
MMEISICVGSACHLKGSQRVIKRLQELVKMKNLEDKIVIKASFCLGECNDYVSVKVRDEISSVNESTVDEFFYENVLGRL